MSPHRKSKRLIDHGDGWELWQNTLHRRYVNSRDDTDDHTYQVRSGEIKLFEKESQAREYLKEKGLV